MYQANVALFRAVHTIPFARLKDIICAHYGAKQFDVEWKRIGGARRGSVSGNPNLYLYLSITNRLGGKDGAVRDIMTVYGQVTTMDLTASEHLGGETSAPQRTQPPVTEFANPSVIDSTAMIETVESAIEVSEDAEDTREYLEAFKCNTTHSCCFEIRDSECNGEDSENDNCDDDWCSDQDDDDDNVVKDQREDNSNQVNNGCPVSAPANGKVIQEGLDSGCILDAEHIEKPIAVIEDG